MFGGSEGTYFRPPPLTHDGLVPPTFKNKSFWCNGGNTIKHSFLLGENEHSNTTHPSSTKIATFTHNEWRGDFLELLYAITSLTHHNSDIKPFKFSPSIIT